MTTQTFSIVGITVNSGNAKVRFTDDMVRRVKQFAKGGASRTDFISLPAPMTKIDALKYMMKHPNFQSADDQATISETLYEKERESRKGEVKVKSKPSLEDIRSRSRRPVTTVQDILAATHTG
jgi:hypothetical protein